MLSRVDSSSFESLLSNPPVKRQVREDASSAGSFEEQVLAALKDTLSKLGLQDKSIRITTQLPAGNQQTGQCQFLVTLGGNKIATTGSSEVREGQTASADTPYVPKPYVPNSEGLAFLDLNTTGGLAFLNANQTARNAAYEQWVNDLLPRMRAAGYEVGEPVWDAHDPNNLFVTPSEAIVNINGQDWLLATLWYDQWGRSGTDPLEGMKQFLGPPRTTAPSTAA